MASPYSNLAEIPTPLATYLRTPTRVQRDLEALVSDMFITDFMFREGERAPSGAVVFDEVLEADLRMARDVQEIEELTEFPVLNVGERQPEMARTKKWGGSVLFSYEKIARDTRDLLGQNLRKIRTTVVSKVDRVSMATLNANTNVQTYVAPLPWSDPTSKKIVDLRQAKGMATKTKLGYVPDTVILHETQALELATDENVWKLLPREIRELNPVLSGDLTGLLNLNFVQTDDIAEGTAYVLMRQMAGSVHDERAFYSRVVDLPQIEGTLLMAARQTVPIVTDPICVVRLTGL